MLVSVNPCGAGFVTTTTDGNGNYFLAGLSCVTNNTFTPSKAARLPGSAGINTTDVIAVQRYFLAISLLTGCRLAAADCASPRRNYYRRCHCHSAVLLGADNRDRQCGAV